MEKTIYQLLNEVKTDDQEYEWTELSSKERLHCRQMILKEVKCMKNRKTKTTKTWKTAVAATAAALALVAATVGVCNPVFARNLFSDTFGKLIESARGQKDEADYVDLYSKLGRQSVPVQEEIGQASDRTEYATSVENNGVKVSVSDLYCDGYLLYFTTTLETDDAELMQADGIVPAEKKGTCDIQISGVPDSEGANRAFEQVGDGIFVATNQIDLLGLTDLESKGNTFDVEYTLTDLQGYLWDKWDAQGNYQAMGAVDGEWKLRFPVTVDTSANLTYDIDREQNGITVKNAVITKAGLVLTVELPDFTKEPYNDPFNDPDEAIMDSQGRYLQWLSQKSTQNADGTTTEQIMVLYGEEKELSFVVTNKNTDGSTIADIPFQLP